MERKIGEIFEYNGEWCQCIIGHCNQCSFDKVGTCKFIGNPYCAYRNDKKLVCFKKLEKVGEPYDDCGTILQRFKIYTNVTNADTKGLELHIYSNDTIGIEIKQNKEDMEEYKTPLPKEDNHLTRIVYAYVNGKISDEELIKSIKEMSDEYPFEKNNLKLFSLEAAKSGKPVCTRDGRKARIICFDAKDTQPIIGLYEKNIDGIVREYLCSYHTDGRMYDDQDTGYDLMMLPEKKEGWVNVYKKQIHNTFESAEEGHKGITGYIKTIKVEWEE